MVLDRSEGPICQSCAMEIAKVGKKGTNADGTPNDEYCYGCYDEGEYTDPDITMEAMIDLAAKYIVKDKPGVTLDTVKDYLNEVMPTLKRWKQPAV